MKRNKSMLQILPCVLLCVALAFPGMKATVFAEDRIDTDGTMTENSAMPDNEGITEKENDPFPGSGEFFYEDAASASMDGNALQEGSESAAQEGLYKEDVFTDGEDFEEVGNGTSGDGIFPEGDDVFSEGNDTEAVDKGASADNDFLQKEGNGDRSEDVSRPEMLYPVENNEIPQMTETGEEGSEADPGADVTGEDIVGAEPGAVVPGEDSVGADPEAVVPGEDSAGADPGAAVPGEDSAGLEQDPSEDTPMPEGDGASSEMTALPEESAQDELKEISAGEPSIEADAEEVSDAVSYAPAAGICPLARELTYNGQAQELIDVEDIRKGTLCYSLDGEAFSPEIPTGTDAGEYIVYFRAAEEETAQVSSLTVTISKADVIYTAPSAAE